MADNREGFLGEGEGKYRLQTLHGKYNCALTACVFICSVRRRNPYSICPVDLQLWTKPKLAKVERATMFKVFLRTKTYLITVIALGICSCAITGCVESTFTLASESKLPRSMTLPPGLTRTDVSVTLNLYAPLRGPDAKFVLTDRKGKKLAEVKGKTKELAPSMYYQIVTEKGISEIIKLKPYREHENMEQNGRAVALFYVIDDPALGKELLAGDAGSHAN